jgi:hypothetical protein
MEKCFPGMLLEFSEILIQSQWESVIGPSALVYDEKILILRMTYFNFHLKSIVLVIIENKIHL